MVVDFHPLDYVRNRRLASPVVYQFQQNRWRMRGILKNRFTKNGYEIPIATFRYPDIPATKK